jgi:hypothetical protein
VASAAFLLGAAATAQAVTYSTTIGGSGCLSCFGSVYSLGVQEVGSGGGNTTYNVTYSVNTTNYSGQGTGLDAIAFKIANFNNIVTAPTVAGVGTFSSPSVLDGLSANGCGSGGTSGFICTQSSNTGGVAVPNGTYTFNINGLVLKTGTLFTNVSEWSLKALYVDSTGKQAGLTSENGSVPVPGTVLLFGLGFSLFVMWRHGSKHGLNAQAL